MVGQAEQIVIALPAAGLVGVPVFFFDPAGAFFVEFQQRGFVGAAGEDAVGAGVVGLQLFPGYVAGWGFQRLTFTDAVQGEGP